MSDKIYKCWVTSHTKITNRVWTNIRKRVSSPTLNETTPKIWLKIDRDVHFRVYNHIRETIKEMDKNG